MRQTIFVIMTMLFFTFSELSFAQQSTDKSKRVEVSKDARQKMAEMHQQMADCLKSDKSFAECHKGMMANCPMMKDGNCPMMGSEMPMMYWHDKMHDGNGSGCCGGNYSDPQQEKSK